MNEVVVMHASNDAVVAQQVISLEDLVSRFIAALDVTQNSKYTYARQIKQFIVWLDQTGKTNSLATLSRHDILAYKEYLISIRKSSYTVGGYITVVRKFFEWLESEKIFPNIARGVKGVKKAKGFRKDCLTVAQIIKVLQTIDRSTIIGLRDYALINLLVRTGLRTVEVGRTRVEDLRQEAGEALLWVQGKGRSSRDEFVLVVEEALQPVREYLSARKKLHDQDPLFGQVRYRKKNPFLTTRMISGIVKSRLRAAGLNDRRLSAHSLRHTAISLSIKGGADLIQAQAMARHADPKTTMVYFHNQSRISNGAERCIKI
jgi:integrase/recombinase XerC/integrase/recombinase XerD